MTEGTPKSGEADIVELHFVLIFTHRFLILASESFLCEKVCAPGQPEFFQERDRGILAGANFMVVVHRVISQFCVSSTCWNNVVGMVFKVCDLTRQEGQQTLQKSTIIYQRCARAEQRDRQAFTRDFDRQ